MPKSLYRRSLKKKTYRLVNKEEKDPLVGLRVEYRVGGQKGRVGERERRGWGGEEGKGEKKTKKECGGGGEKTNEEYAWKENTVGKED